MDRPPHRWLILLGVLGLAVLVAVERRAVAPVVPLRLLSDRVTGRLLAAGATATFGLYACVMLLPRYFQAVRDVSATESGLLIYPLLIGLLLAVNVGAAVIVRCAAFRGTLLVGNALVAVGALGFLTLDEGSSVWLPLALMAVLGAGLGPALSGLQIAISRAVDPRDLGAAMGTLLLGRQVGGALALAAAEAAYTGRMDASASAAAATGWGVFVVAACGAGLAVVALAGLRRSEGRLSMPPATASVDAPDVVAA